PSMPLPYPLNFVISYPLVIHSPSHKDNPSKNFSEPVSVTPGISGMIRSLILFATVSPTL
ncbi:MAG: hypothetical protein Q4C84_16595, partial [Bacillota bacterium]|nr:hypothetical protein [Bacillota bacterium]